MSCCSRRSFIKDGAAAFTLGFAAPAFLSDIARAQGARSRNLVVLYLSGGNDALSMLVPYQDAAYYDRRPSLAIPAADVLQIGSDTRGKALGFHPRLSGLRSIFNQGRLAIVQRTGYAESSRSHFEGLEIWGTGDVGDPTSSAPQFGVTGWLGRYLDVLPSPVDPLIAWNTLRDTPRALMARGVGVPGIPDALAYSFASPNRGDTAINERLATARIASHIAVDRPHVSFVNGTIRGVLNTLDRVAPVANYAPSLPYPDSDLGEALQMVAGSIVQGIGTRVYWVQTGGYDTHAGQGGSGGYEALMGTLNDGVLAFYSDLRNHGLLNDTLILEFSEFGRRIPENGSQGTDHGAGGLMMAIGGAVRGGIYGTAASLNPDPENPTLENNGTDVRYETDFRAVYAKVLDSWLGVDSTRILGQDFRRQAPAIV
jgi:uncharacterized protein (DUF1501 family)